MKFDPISLPHLNAMAALQTRVDRKYVIDRAGLEPMLDSMASKHRVLEIDDQQAFGYQSVYFDTPGLDLYLAAATSRRRRYKVRTRTYLESGLCMLEVKTKGPRGETSKKRLRYNADDEARLTPEAERFISDIVGGLPVQLRPDRLVPALTTSYRRSTFVDPGSATRLTIDDNLVCTDWAGSSAALAAIVVETKSSNAPSPTDRWLWARGVRPAKISKCCTGLAALHPELPSNKWRRALRHDWALLPEGT